MILFGLFYSCNVLETKLCGKCFGVFETQNKKRVIQKCIYTEKEDAELNNSRVFFLSFSC